MTEETLHRDWSVEIRGGIVLIAWRHIPSLAPGIQRQRRLKQRIANANEIALPMVAGTDGIGGLVAGAPVAFEQRLRQFAAGPLHAGDAARRNVPPGAPGLSFR